jgi:hypothetical protein
MKKLSPRENHSEKVSLQFLSLRHYPVDNVLGYRKARANRTDFEAIRAQPLNLRKGLVAATHSLRGIFSAALYFHAKIRFQNAIQIRYFRNTR